MVRKIVTELKGFDNVYYEICNEPYFGGVTMEWQHRIAEVIAETEKGFRASTPDRAEHRQQQDRRSTSRNPPCRSSISTTPAAGDGRRELGPEQAIGDDETGFDGTENKPYRREAWEFMLAGGALYNNLDYSFSVGMRTARARSRRPAAAARRCESKCGF